MSNHGYIASCLGPVVDVQLISDVYRENKTVYSRVREGLVYSEILGQKDFYIGRDVFYPTVYDSMTIVRPSVCFREGITAANCMSRFNTFILGLPYNTAYLLAVTHLIPLDYSHSLEILVHMHWSKQTDGLTGIFGESYSRMEVILVSNNRQDLVLGFMSLYLLIKSYSNSLVAEVSQQMYGGVLRCISLGSTEGLSTWRCSIQLNVQAAVVPVGRISLGRILNVVGSAVDFYDDQPITLAYGQSPICRSHKEGVVGPVPIGRVLMTIVDQMLVSILY